MERDPLVKQLLQNRRRIFGFIYTLTRDVDTAEEIFQEVSVAVLEESSMRPDVARFLPWVCEVARHRVADYYRNRRRRPPVSTLLTEAAAEVFERNEETREEAARPIRGLQALLECLRGKQLVGERGAHEPSRRAARQVP